jgi:hypothetical protein
MQGVYKGGTVHPTGLTINQGCSQVSTGLPPRAPPACIKLVRDQKMVPGLSLGGTGEGEETSSSENETRLVAVGPPEFLPGGRPQRHGLPGVAFASMQASRRLKETSHPATRP